ncbi:MAG TPA: phosphotransferase [Acidimicrobiales bacterium]|nr:phosphotransferase [Acidimicrobiales bacterium]
MASRPVFSSLGEMLAGATIREPMTKGIESLSGARFERVVIGGDRFVVKHLHPDDDWVMRATGDLRCRPALLWQAGIFDLLPATIDHAIVAVATGLGRGGLGAALLLADVSETLVPDVADPLPEDQHLRFLEHMADLHATCWAIPPHEALCPAANRAFFLTPWTTTPECGRSTNDPVPPLIAPGWDRLRRDAPAAADLIWELLRDPSRLLRPLASLPATLIHGDWKAGNLGSHRDGRTVLLDWAFPGRAPGPWDLAWYIAVNCDRLPRGPHAKDDAIAAYRASLARRIDVSGWWQEALGLSLIAAFCQLGWSKSGDELEWWKVRVADAARFLA